jgi:hypothetical protein
LGTEEIVNSCKQEDAHHWQKRFEEDLVEILARTGHEPGRAVDLELRSVETGQNLTLAAVPNTEENRRALVDAARARRAQTQSNNSRKRG